MTDKKPLPGWLWMISGLVIIAYTKFIQARKPESKIGLFFWIGIAFIVYGILREFVPRMMSRRAKKERQGPPPHVVHNYLRPQGTSHRTHQHTAPQQHPSHPYEPMHKQCPRCHVLTHGQGRFCHNCGHQFY